MVRLLPASCVSYARCLQDVDFRNVEEAELVLGIVQGFLAAGALARDIVVLAPFAAQLKFLKELPSARKEPLHNQSAFGIGVAAQVGPANGCAVF
jgi:hypothetical protein